MLLSQGVAIKALQVSQRVARNAAAGLVAAPLHKGEYAVRDGRAGKEGAVRPGFGNRREEGAVRPVFGNRRGRRSPVASGEKNGNDGGKGKVAYLVDGVLIAQSPAAGALPGVFQRQEERLVACVLFEDVGFQLLEHQVGTDGIVVGDVGNAGVGVAQNLEVEGAVESGVPDVIDLGVGPFAERIV